MKSTFSGKGLTYEQFRDQVDKMVIQKSTSGENQSEQFVQYTMMNKQRMDRHEKTDQLSEDTISILKNISEPQHWVLFTEAWCGDAAHATPIIHKMSSVNPLTDLKIFYRDEDEASFEHFLTAGKKSIPKLIGFDENYNELFRWGPRPEKLQQEFEHWLEMGINSDEVKKQLQIWYNKDKTLTTQEEITALIKACVLVG